MARTQPEREHENEYQHRKEHQERSQARCRPKNGNRDILAEELPHDAAVHRHHVAGKLRHAVGTEGKQARKVKRKERAAYRKAQYARADGTNCNEKPPQHEARRKRDNRQLTENKAEKVRQQFTKVRA